MTDRDRYQHFSVVRTKLHRPPVNDRIVCRQRLHELLDQGLQMPLTLVSAPAGYGKSILVSHWAEAVDAPCAWLSMDASDGDLRTFVTYLLAAIRTVAPEVGAATEGVNSSANPLAVAVLGAYLVNDLDKLESDVVLVLDDYHRIEPTSPVHGLLRFVLEHPPRHLHVTVVTRSDPPLPLSALRSGLGIAEVRLRDLQFVPEESTEFLAHGVGLTVSDAALANLQSQTEGWAAGLQFLALHLRHEKDPEKFLLELRGGVQQSQEYLLHEVFAVEAEAMRSSLLRASILDRFNAELLDAVCGPETSTEASGALGQTFISSLESDNLFVIALDARGQWYRYHHLFQEMLQAQLKRDASAEEIAELHRRASSWFEDQELIVEAIHHALESSDITRAAEIVERHRRAEFTADRWHVVEQWLAMLPTEIKQQRPELLVTEAWAAYYRIQVERVAQLIEQIESRFGDHAEIPALAAELAFFQGFGCYWTGDADGAIRLLEKASSLCGHQESFCAAETEVYLSMARCMDGQKNLAIRALEERIQGSVSPPGLYLSHLYIGLAISHLMTGELHRTRADAQRGINVATEAGIHNARAWCTYLEGGACLQSGDLDAAAHQFTLTAELRYVLDPIASTDALAGLVLANQLLGREDEATTTLDLLASFARETNDPLCLSMAESAGYRLAVLRGDLSAAAIWVQSLAGTPSPAELVLWLEVPALTRIRAMIAVGTDECLEKASALLGEIRRVCEDCHFVGQTIEATVLQSLVLDAQGEAEEALRVLGEALAMAEPGGWVRPFMEAGPVMTRMLQRRSERVGAEDFVQRLLGASAEAPAIRPAAAATVAAEEEIHPLDELTNRERDVLELLARRLHNQEIADRLCISPHTVNFHLKQIYQKLDTHNRRQAVDRALELGILDLRGEG